MQALLASGVTRNVTVIVPRTYHTPFSYQTSVGVERQIGQTVSVKSDYVYTASRNEGFTSVNGNLTYNPVTGANYPFNNAATLPFPNWGLVTLNVGNGYSNYYGWTTQFTKRFSGRWQASGNYTLSLLKDAAGWNTLGPIPAGFKLAPDLGEEYTDAVGDQRHRATLNAIYDLGRGFQASGLYFFGSGERYATSYGGDLRRVGVGSTGRLRPDGTIVPRNNFVGDPIHRMDVRLQKRVPLGGRVVIDVIGEVFNLLNHANYAVYTTSESSRAYGKPSPTTALPFSPRMGQLAFRLGF